MKPRMPEDLHRLSTRLLRDVSNMLGLEHGAPRPVLVNSIPKSGTNLLLNIVLAMPGTQYAGDLSLAAERDVPEDRLIFVKERILDLRSGRVYTGHIPYAIEIAEWLCEQGIKQLFIYRDPRDYTVSLYHYVMREAQPRHAYYEMFSNLGSDSERLLGAIRGIGQGQTKYRLSPSSVPNVRLIYEAYMGWITDKNTFALRYEDLVRGRAGQRSNKAASTVMDILWYLGVIRDTHDITLVDNILTEGMDPGKSHTFRRGGSGAWREEYTEQHIEAFRSVADDLLTELGYTWE